MIYFWRISRRISWFNRKLEQELKLFLTRLFCYCDWFEKVDWIDLWKTFGYFYCVSFLRPSKKQYLSCRVKNSDAILHEKDSK